MKKTLTLIALALGLTVHAQVTLATVTNVVNITNIVNITTNTSILGSGVLNSLYNMGSGILKATPTNFVVAPYVTYAPPKVAGDKTWGEGVAIGYNVSENVGLLAAVDHLNSLTLINGTLQFRAKVHPFQNLPFVNFGTNTWAYKAMVTPNVIGGPVLNPSNLSNIGTVEGGGAAIQLFTFSNFALDCGYEYATMSFINVPTSRQRHQAFIALRGNF